VHISKNLDHLGIVAGVCNEIKVAEEIDRIIGVDPRQIVTCGQAVVAMILNALGFVDRPLYLFPEFLKNKPVELLISPNLVAEDFNDDVLGRTLDKLSAKGLEEIFTSVASTTQTYVQGDQFFHSDTTSMSVHGRYEHDDEAVPIQITHGYPKDHRVDLKQFVVSMVTCGGLPVFVQTLSGNTSDKDHFRDLFQNYGTMLMQAWGKNRIWVWDSAFYTETNIKALPSETLWITRVPETLLLAQETLRHSPQESMKATSIEGYSLQSITMTYAEIPQRWIVVFSQQAYDRKKKTLDKNIQREKEQIKNMLWHLSHQEFQCREDGLSALHKLAKKWNYHCIQDIYVVEKQRKKNNGQGRPKIGDTRTVYQITAIIKEDDETMYHHRQSLGRFIVATNELDPKKLSDEDALQAYKDQQQVEHGFRFLKDPLFFTHAIFLKTERRIQAMVMIMGLALLVYAIAERKLRKALETMDEMLPDQRNKPTKTPTMRRIFQLFEGVTILYDEHGREQLEVMNLGEVTRKILVIFGVEYERMYCVANIG
jgi:transposase